MAKIKLTKVLRESLEEVKQLRVNRERIQAHLDLFAKRLENLKSKMKKDGYNV